MDPKVNIKDFDTTTFKGRLDYIAAWHGFEKKSREKCMADLMEVAVPTYRKYYFGQTPPQRRMFLQFKIEGWNLDWLLDNKGEPRAEKAKNVEILEEYLEFALKMKRTDLYESLRKVDEKDLKKHSRLFLDLLALATRGVEEKNQ
ncbi:hypothetical protein [Leptospira kmetyi]|uniref:CRISPR type III A-associated protein Csm2 n=1 Tax=Leptospira kmetyi TaxID=408139 RepID=A0ABX4NC89_9LEPT|nr:hypothetical protein [Leptospira kmetyi]PJZ29060.1 hypothetical protein CH378_14310 [Leptospira kmetyi]PJZ39696.1 hypothetical protein CH370_19775 [Leptospira kmetyi]